MNGPAPLTIRPAIRVLAGIFAIAAIVLGRWQIQRDGERNVGREQALLVAEMPPLGDGEPLWPSAGWRLVEWPGRYVGPTVLMAGTQRKGERGYNVLQAFERSAGGRVLVDRGWVSAESARASVDPPASVGSPMLRGLLRPMTEENHTPPIEGHGTRIFTGGDHPGAASALGANTELYVVEGNPDGTPLSSHPPIGGFTRIPARDNTSLHYASQWFAIAAIGLLFAFPRPLIYLRQKMGA